MSSICSNPVADSLSSSVFTTLVSQVAYPQNQGMQSLIPYDVYTKIPVFNI